MNSLVFMSSKEAVIVSLVYKAQDIEETMYLQHLFPKQIWLLITFYVRNLKQLIYFFFLLLTNSVNIFHQWKGKERTGTLQVS